MKSGHGVALALPVRLRRDSVNVETHKIDLISSRTRRLGLLSARHERRQPDVDRHADRDAGGKVDLVARDHRDEQRGEVDARLEEQPDVPKLLDPRHVLGRELPPPRALHELGRGAAASRRAPGRRPQEGGVGAADALARVVEDEIVVAHGRVADDEEAAAAAIRSIDYINRN